MDTFQKWCRPQFCKNLCLRIIICRIRAEEILTLSRRNRLNWLSLGSQIVFCRGFEEKAVKFYYSRDFLLFCFCGSNALSFRTRRLFDPLPDSWPTLNECNHNKLATHISCSLLAICSHLNAN